ncbi:MAG: hypothetical protein CVV27_06500 [Candidatus Melainabacteria bacterium HGW-Melainabacteria-1]|nr:MAG: hypothetical protein CVV27_06500 [Candidatus Melainabacteria bacterium HGW-Melainabacteria-1]
MRPAQAKTSPVTGRLWRALDRLDPGRFDVAADARLVAGCRIGFGILLLLYIHAIWQSRTLIWPAEAGPALWQYGLWTAAGLAILIGWPARLGFALNYLMIYSLVMQQKTSFTVAELFLLWLSLSGLWLETDRALSPRRRGLRARGRGWGKASIPGEQVDLVPGWPIWLLGLAYTTSLFIAGWTKLYDPLWREGWGLYYTLLLPWIKWRGLAWILDFPNLMLALNYLAIGFELLALPLFLWRPTRRLSALLLLIFAGILISLSGLSFIGHFGLLIALLLLALRPDKRVPVPAAKGARAIWDFLLSRRLLPLALGLLIGIPALNELIKLPAMHYPAAYPPLRLTGPTGQRVELNAHLVQRTLLSPLRRPGTLGLYLPLKRAYNVLHRINQVTYRIDHFALFNAQHTIGIYAYRLRVTLRDGRVDEPREVFRPDKTPGSWIGPFTGVWYQTQIYLVSQICHDRLTGAPADPSLVERLRRLLQSVHADTGSPVDRITLEVSPMLAPVGYLGNTDLPFTTDWTPLYSWNAASNNYTWLRPPPPYPFRYPIQGTPYHLRSPSDGTQRR